MHIFIQSHRFFSVKKMRLSCFATGSKHWKEATVFWLDPSALLWGVGRCRRYLLRTCWMSKWYREVLWCSLDAVLSHTTLVSRDCIQRSHPKKWHSPKTYNEIGRQIDVFHHLCIKWYMRGQNAMFTQAHQKYQKVNSITPHIIEGKFSCALHGLISGGSLT